MRPKPTRTEQGFVRLETVEPFVAYLQRKGIDTSLAFASVGLSEASVSDPNAFVRAEIIYGLVNRFAELAGDRYLGARVGETHDFSKWPPFAQATATAKTLVEFFATLIRTVPDEASSVEHKLEIGANVATYCVSRTIATSVRPVQVTGFACAHYLRLFRSVTGDIWDPAQVTFASALIDGVPPSYAGIETQTSRDPGIQLRFPVEWLFRDVALDVQPARQAGSDIPQDSDLVLAMRAEVSNHLDTGDLSLAGVANLLGIEPHLLERALKEIGTTVPREIKRLKIDTAKAMLENSAMTIAEISLALGYNHQAHFTRFFQTQTGQSPSEFRNMSRASNKDILSRGL